MNIGGNGRAELLHSLSYILLVIYIIIVFFINILTIIYYYFALQSILRVSAIPNITS